MRAGSSPYLGFGSVGRAGWFRLLWPVALLLSFSPVFASRAVGAGPGDTGKVKYVSSETILVELDRIPRQKLAAGTPAAVVGSGGTVVAGLRVVLHDGTTVECHRAPTSTAKIRVGQVVRFGAEWSPAPPKPEPVEREVRRKIPDGQETSVEHRVLPVPKPPKCAYCPHERRSDALYHDADQALAADPPDRGRALELLFEAKGAEEEAIRLGGRRFRDLGFILRRIADTFLTGPEQNIGQAHEWYRQSLEPLERWASRDPEGWPVVASTRHRQALCLESLPTPDLPGAVRAYGAALEALSKVADPGALLRVDRGFYRISLAGLRCSDVFDDCLGSADVARDAVGEIESEWLAGSRCEAQLATAYGKWVEILIHLDRLEELPAVVDCGLAVAPDDPFLLGIRSQLAGVP